LAFLFKDLLEGIDVELELVLEGLAHIAEDLLEPQLALVELEELFVAIYELLGFKVADHVLLGDEVGVGCFLVEEQLDVKVLQFDV
jgi:hypothetical protein